ncbi:hypothetical protein BD626DRAFT_587082 [Schizophyllum amplum]|uniref:Uncharacterized protein n=1 Tax=Schizophyllum amplum TaxID=97359 RepID=A0A550BW68_9AGAR|nr:hypothetical protein BD626DRAFT_587082 [Auriculariopsis ampla]
MPTAPHSAAMTAPPGPNETELHRIESASKLGDGQAVLSSTSRALSSPITTVYPDVLLYIFSLVCADCEITSPHSTPVVLSHVCRHWRRLTLGCPPLWSTIHTGYCPYIEGDDMRASLDDGSYIKDERKPSAFIARVARTVDMYLARSQPAPLDIECRDLYGSIAEVREAVGAIVDHSERWQHLTISADLLSFVDAARGRMPLLERAAVFDDSVNCVDIPTPFNTFATAPRLTRWACDYELHRVTLPWAQLEEVEFEEIEFEEIDAERLARVVPEMVRLRRVVAHMHDAPPPPPTQEGRAQEGRIEWPPSLDSFTLIMKAEPEDYTRPAGFLALCTLPPHLRALRVEPECWDAPGEGVRYNIGWDHGVFMRMAARSGLGELRGSGLYEPRGSGLYEPRAPGAESRLA